MTIPASHFATVIPGVVSAGGTALTMNGLFLTQSYRVPIGIVLSFASQPAVAAFFGANSPEAAAATVYFAGFTNATKFPAAMLFAQYPGSTPAATFTATISGTTMTVSAVSDGALAVGQTISGSGVTVGTIITALGTGTGGTGTYTIDVSQTVGSPTSMTAMGPGVAAWLQSGNVALLGLAALQAITSGSLTLTVDGYAHTIASLNLSSASSFSSAASIIQAALSDPSQASFTASIATDVLTVTAVSSGTLAVGQTVTGAGVPPNTVITALGTGTGNTGTYILNTSSTVSSESMSALATQPTVTFDSTSGGFLVTSGVTGVASTMAFATGSVAATLLMTQGTGASISQGAAASTPSAFMGNLVQTVQNWATFTTVFDPDAGVGNTLKLAFGAWTNGQLNRYAYVGWDTDQTPTLSSAATQSFGYLVGPNGNNYSGICPISEPGGGESAFHYAAFVMGFTASLDFSAKNGRATLAYKSQTGLVASVTSLQVAANLEANGYNYYGAAATANASFLFMFPGTISGPFKWFDSYVNQIWLNASLQLALLQLMTNTNSIPYNAAGFGAEASALQDPINQAINFGAIRQGVKLSSAQIAQVNSQAGKAIDQTLSQQGFYLSITDPGAAVRAARGSPVGTLFYMDGQSVQQITLTSLDVQ